MRAYLIPVEFHSGKERNDRIRHYRVITLEKTEKRVHIARTVKGYFMNTKNEKETPAEKT